MPEGLSRRIMLWQSGQTDLVLLSEVCKEEEVCGLGTLELSRISGTFLSPWGFWMILLVLCHDHTVIRLQEQLFSPEPLVSLRHMNIYIYIYTHTASLLWSLSLLLPKCILP